MPSRLATALMLLLLPIAASAGCRRSRGGFSGPLPESNTDKTSSAATTAAAASSTATATATAPTGPSTAEPVMLKGRWHGTYEAKRALINLSKSTPWPAWKRDAGKQVGKGTAEFEIDANGQLHGKISGPLGPMMLVGRVEDGVIRGRALPAEPPAVGTMAGVFMGGLRGDTIHATLRASNGRGEAVRSAELTLNRK